MAAPRKTEARHRARELATQLLYSLDNHPGQEIEEALELFLGEESLAEAEHPEVKEYCRFLARGAWEKKAEADEILLRVVTGWRPERMVSVDRAVLRMAIFEGFLSQAGRVPFALAISEAVKIARVFGTDSSARFVNGVLARVAGHLFPEEARRKAGNRSEEEHARSEAAEGTPAPASR